MSTFTRSFDLLDISIRSDAGGRTVDAYAAVFDTETQISDGQGNYREVIARGAFNQTLKRNEGRSFPVLYNHGMTLHGTPSDQWSVPIGRSVEVYPDGKGLRTLSVYNDDAAAERVLSAIRNDSVRSQSFSGRWVQSTPALKRGQVYRPDGDGKFPLVQRNQIDLIEYGPTPMPAYDVPMVNGVRAALLGMSDEERRAFLLSLNVALDCDDDEAEEAAESDGSTGEGPARAVATENPDRVRLAPNRRAAAWLMTTLEKQ